MRVHVRRISPASFALTLCIFYGAAGLCIAVLGSFGGLLSLGIVSTTNLGTLLLQPLISAVGGLVTGFIIAWAYNFVARFTMGVVIDCTKASDYAD